MSARVRFFEVRSAGHVVEARNLLAGRRPVHVALAAYATPTGRSYDVFSARTLEAEAEHSIGRLLRQYGASAVLVGVKRGGKFDVAVGHALEKNPHAFSAEHWRDVAGALRVERVFAKSKALFAAKK